MATVYWEGAADAVAQIDTVQITGYDVTTTYTLTVGGETVSTIGVTDADGTATALAAAWEASTSAYFTGVAATAATDTVTLTAAVAGLPFTATSSVNGGVGTIAAVTSSVSVDGPNFWSSTGNWSTGSVPVNADDVVFRDGSINVVHGLAQSAVTLDSLTVEKSYTGLIGLNYTEVATVADGATTDDSKPEYRAVYLDIGSTLIDLGQNFGPTVLAGSRRICLDTASAPSTITVHDTATQSLELGRNSVRLLADDVATDIFVRAAPGGVGLAAEIPGETSTVNNIDVSATATGSSVEIGTGANIDEWIQSGGSNVINTDSAVTSITMNGGSLQVEGDFLVTTVQADAGTLTLNNVNSGGVEVTTLNIDGGTVDFSKSSEARVVTTVNHTTGTLIGNSDFLTVTTYNEPATGSYTLNA